MTDAAAPDAALRRTFLVGGGLLITSGVATAAGPTLFMSSTALSPFVFWAGTVAFSGALVVFALGLGRSGSLVAGRPLAVGAMLLLAAWPFAERVLTYLVPYASDTADFYRSWGYLSYAVELAAAIVIVVQIARAGVVAGGTRWAPLWALAAVVLPQVLVQALMVALQVDLNTQENDGISLIWGAGRLAVIAAPIVLGILAILQANRPVEARAERPTVQVYPPAP